MKKLWLDDIRQPPNNSWHWAKTVEEAIEYAQENEIDYMSLDHDLGAVAPEGWRPSEAIYLAGNSSDGSGLDFVRWIVEHAAWPSGQIVVHSWNSAGSKRMCDMIDTYGPYKERAEYRPYKVTGKENDIDWHSSAPEQIKQTLNHHGIEVTHD
jgi:hypothetical protein